MLKIVCMQYALQDEFFLEYITEKISDLNIYIYIDILDIISSKLAIIILDEI